MIQGFFLNHLNDEDKTLFQKAVRFDKIKITLKRSKKYLEILNKF